MYALCECVELYFSFYLLLSLFPENILLYFPLANVNLDLCFGPSPLPNSFTEKYVTEIRTVIAEINQLTVFT